jgi:hypothetical protein
MKESLGEAMSAALDVLEEIVLRLQQGHSTAADRVRRFNSLDLDEESEDSLRSAAIDLRNDLHHIEGLLQEVLTNDVPALRGALPGT